MTAAASPDEVLALMHGTGLCLALQRRLLNLEGHSER